MARFRYEAVNPSGKTVRGIEDAASRDALLSELHRNGLLPLSVDAAANAPATDFLGSLRARWGRSELRLSFIREMASLLNAGLRSEEALAILAEMPDNARLASLAEEMRAEVRRGASFARALEAGGDIFPSHVKALVAAGEASGALGPVLTRLSQDLSRAAALNAQIATALVYPAILLGVLTLVLGLVFVFVIPAFEEVFIGYESELPAATKALLAISRLLSAHGFIVLAVLLLATAGAAHLIKRPTIRRRIERAWLDPKIGFGLGIEIASARFCRLVGLLLSQGVPLITALTLTAPTLGSRLLDEALQEIARRVREGASLGAAIRQAGIFPPLIERATGIGEETGRLPSLLQELALKLEQDIAMTVSRLVAVLVPALTLLMGAIVALVVGSILVGIMSLQRSLI